MDQLATINTLLVKVQAEAPKCYARLQGIVATITAGGTLSADDQSFLQSISAAGTTGVWPSCEVAAGSNTWIWIALVAAIIIAWYVMS